MAKLTKTQLAAKGKAIMNEAKKIYEASNKKTKWTSCVSKAAKALKKKKK